jgi:hypothetical protein
LTEADSMKIRLCQCSGNCFTALHSANRSWRRSALTVFL